MKKRLPFFIIPILLLGVFLSFAQMEVAHAFSSDDLQKALLGDIITDRNNKQDVGYMEEMLAGLITAIPRWLIAFLNLKDVNQLIFLDNNWIYHTFPADVWYSANTFYSLAMSVAAYLLVLAMIGWGIILLTRAASAGAQMTAKDMVQGFVIYIGSIWLGSYLFEMIFKINEFFVKFALYGLQSAGVPTTINFLNLFLILEKQVTLGGSIMFLIIVICIGVLNYQYALRMLMLVILIILFPICAYTSIFPSSRKAFDLWFREFCSQVFMNGGQAIGYALFLVLMKNGASNWTLFAFLFGMPHITGVVRLMFGAPGRGGVVKGSMGVGSAIALSQIMSATKGSGGAGALSAIASGGLPALAKLGAATTAGAIIGGALMGEQGAKMGAGTGAFSVMPLASGGGGRSNSNFGYNGGGTKGNIKDFISNGGEGSNGNSNSSGGNQHSKSPTSPTRTKPTRNNQSTQTSTPYQPVRRTSQNTSPTRRSMARHSGLINPVNNSPVRRSGSGQASNQGQGLNTNQRSNTGQSNPNLNTSPRSNSSPSNPSLNTNPRSNTSPSDPNLNTNSRSNTSPSNPSTNTSPGANLRPTRRTGKP